MALIELNEQQQTVVECRAQHKRISAGPGTGKTHLSVQLLIDAHRSGKIITAASFTRNATEEIARRFCNALDIKEPEAGEKGWAKTIYKLFGHKFTTVDALIWNHAIKHKIITAQHSPEHIKRHPKTGKLLSTQNI